MRSRRDQGSRKGIFLVIGAVMLGLLFAFLGMAFDLGWLYHQRRWMQAAADAGSFYGGQAIRRGDTSAEIETEAKRGSTENGFADGVEGAVVRADHPPTTGNYIGQNFAVEVAICQPQSIYFMPVFNVWSSGVCTRAVSGYLGDSPNCIYALDPTEEKTMYVSSDSTLCASCGIQVNSDDDAGLYVDSGACLKATSVGVTGDDWLEDECKVGGFPTLPDPVVPNPSTEVVPPPDPFLGLPPPAFGICTPGYESETTINSGSPGSPIPIPATPVSPGTPVVLCNGLKVVSGGHVQFQSNTIFVLAGGIFEISSLSGATGSGVMFYFTDGPAGEEAKGLYIGSQSTAAFSAPTSGTYEAILFFVDPTLNPASHTANIAIASHSGIILEGAIYNRNFTVTFHSGTLGETLDSDCLVIVADVVEVTSDADLVVNNTCGGFPGGSPINRVQLLG